MAVSFVRSLGTGGGSANPTITVAAGGAAAGDLVVVAACSNVNPPTAYTDTGGNTYSVAHFSNNSTGGVRLFYSVLATALNAGDSITPSGGGGNVASSAATFTGVAAVPLDQHTGAGAGTGTSHSSGTTGTTTQNDEVAIAAFGVESAQTYTADAAYTLLDSFTSTCTLGWGYEILSSTGTQSATFTDGNVAHDGVIATFKAFVPPPPGPNVQTTNESSTNTAGTSHTVNLPSGIQANDLLLVLLDKGSTAATINSLAGWTELLDENSANGLYIAYRYADGSEGATITLTSSASTRDATITYRISGAQDPAIQAPQIGTTATGTDVNPDPPSVTPTGGAKDYLFIAFFGGAGEEADDDTWVNTPPANYENLLQKACGTVGTNLGGKIGAAQRNTNTASEDPGTFNQDVSTAWRAQTIVVHPAPSAATVIPDVTHARYG